MLMKNDDREPRAERIPPQDVETEMACLGAMLMNRETIGEVLEIISREDSRWFYHRSHQKLFEVLVDLYDTGQPIDLRVMVDELRRRELLKELGDEEYLIHLAESFGDWANAQYYAKIVRDKGMLRDLIRCAGQIIDKAYAETEEATHILDDAERRLFVVTEQRIRSQAAPLRTFLQNIALHLDPEENQGPRTGLPSGFIALDQMTNGFQFGDFIVIAARPSMGKTALGLSMALNMAVQEKIPVGFFSMEMSGEQVANRLLCSHLRFDSQKFRSRTLSKPERRGLIQGCVELSNLPIYVDDTPGMTILELRSKARRMYMQHQVQVIFVDYLQLMSAPGMESRQTEVASISRGLKALGRELNVPVVVMAQLNRMSEERQGHRPRMSDLRESGAIEQDADVILLIHREEYFNRSDDPNLKGKAEIIIAKQRNGPTGEVELHYHHSYTRFDNRKTVGQPSPPLPKNDDLPEDDNGE